MTCTIRLDLGDNTQLIRELGTFFAERQSRAWATGGFLRDSILRRPAHDIDIAVDGDPLELGPVLAAALGGHYFPLREERGQARILLTEPRRQIDLMPLRAPDIEGDLCRRDYTIDAMAARLTGLADGNAELLDPTGGQDDLEVKLVRMTGEQAFADDPVRLLRGPRIATELGFEIEQLTADAIQRRAATITSVSAERQRDEIARICSTPRAGAGLRLSDTLGLFPYVFSEMEVTRGVEQPKEHYYDVLGHSFAAVDALDWLMSRERPRESLSARMWEDLWAALERRDELREYFDEEIVPGTRRLALLKLCGLLHDIAKPETKTFEASGRMRFFGHSEKGAELAAELMRRLRFSSREIRMVSRMIDAHLRPIQLGQEGAPSRKAVYKFFRDTGDAGIETLFLSLADHLASVGPRVNEEGFRRHVVLINFILQTQFGEGQAVSMPKLVDGDILMASFGLEPGPLLGELLEAIREAQAVREVQTVEEAIALARAKLAERPSVERE